MKRITLLRNVRVNFMRSAETCANRCPVWLRRLVMVRLMEAARGEEHGSSSERLPRRGSRSSRNSSAILQTQRERKGETLPCIKLVVSSSHSLQPASQPAHSISVKYKSRSIESFRHCCTGRARARFTQF